MLPRLLTEYSSYASILKWMSFSNHEVIPHLGGWTLPLIGREPYNKKSVETHQQAALKTIGVLEKHLLTHTFLVGERITLADIFSAGLLYRGFQNVSR
jgi:elongation factor 1-gamma